MILLILKIIKEINLIEENLKKYSNLNNSKIDFYIDDKIKLPSFK